MRYKILLGGETNTGKTLNLIQTAIQFPDSQTYIFDSEGDVEITLEDMGLDWLLEQNLTVKRVTKDWGQFTSDYAEAKSVLSSGDWCNFDMMGEFWNLAQNYYSREVFGESPAEHIIALKKEAKKAEFGGFDGLTDWVVIKRMHNEDIFDDAVRWSDFNVLATTSLNDVAARAKAPKYGVEGLMFKEFGKKLEGERHNLYRFRTIAILYEDKGEFKYKLVKEKGRELERPLEEHDITGVSFIEKYLENRG